MNAMLTATLIEGIGIRLIEESKEVSSHMRISLKTDGETLVNYARELRNYKEEQ